MSKFPQTAQLDLEKGKKWRRSEKISRDVGTGREVDNGV